MSLQTQKESAQKKLLRRKYANKRLALTEQERERANNHWRNQAHIHLAHLTHKKIGCYFAINQEIDLTLYMDALRAQGNQIYLPRIDELHTDLQFHLYRGDSSLLERGSFNIMQPKADTLHAEPEILLVPLVAFDSQCRRLGYGGGYYDRTITAMATKPMLIGCAYDFQQCDSLPHEPHDIAMDKVITQSKLFSI